MKVYLRFIFLITTLLSQTLKGNTTQKITLFEVIQIAQQQSGKRRKRPVDRACKIVGYKGRNQDKEPEGVHSDGPVHLHDEVEEQHRIQGKGRNDDRGGMSFVYLQMKYGKKKQHNNGDVGHKAVIVPAADTGIDRDECIDDESEDQDYGDPGLLLHYIRIFLEGHQLVNVVSESVS